MAHRLHEHEGAVEHDGDQRHGGELCRAVGGAGGGGGEVGQDQRRHGERAEHREIGRGAGDLDGLLVMLVAADHEAEADEAGEHQHDGGIDRVARDGGAAVISRQHQRHDEADLDDGDGNGEDDRAEGLAHAVAHHLRMVHGGEHRTQQHQRLDGEEQRLLLGHKAGEVGQHEHRREQREGHGPPRVMGMLRSGQVCLLLRAMVLKRPGFDAASEFAKLGAKLSDRGDVP